MSNQPSNGRVDIDEVNDFAGDVLLSIAAKRESNIEAERQQAENFLRQYGAFGTGTKEEQMERYAELGKKFETAFDSNLPEDIRNKTLAELKNGGYDQLIDSAMKEAKVNLDSRAPEGSENPELSLDELKAMTTEKINIAKDGKITKDKVDDGRLKSFKQGDFTFKVESLAEHAEAAKKSNADTFHTAELAMQDGLRRENDREDKMPDMGAYYYGKFRKNGQEEELKSATKVFPVDPNTGSLEKAINDGTGIGKEAAGQVAIRFRNEIKDFQDSKSKDQPFALETSFTNKEGQKIDVHFLDQTKLKGIGEFIKTQDAQKAAQNLSNEGTTAYLYTKEDRHKRRPVTEEIITKENSLVLKDDPNVDQSNLPKAAALPRAETSPAQGSSRAQ